MVPAGVLSPTASAVSPVIAIQLSAMIKLKLNAFIVLQYVELSKLSMHGMGTYEELGGYDIAELISTSLEGLGRSFVVGWGQHSKPERAYIDFGRQDRIYYPVEYRLNGLSTEKDVRIVRPTYHHWWQMCRNVPTLQ